MIMRWFKGSREPSGKGGKEASTPPLLTPQSYHAERARQKPVKHFAQLNEELRHELYQQSEVLRVKIGGDLSTLCQRDGVLLLPVGMVMELALLAGDRRIHLLNIDALFHPDAIPPSIRYELKARESGEVLVLSRSARQCLNSELTSFLSTAWGASGVQLLLQSIGVVGEKVAQRNYLASHWLVQQRQRLDAAERSDAVLHVLQNIPRLPVSSLQLLSILLDDSSSASAVVELVKQDPALSGQLLKAINSPLYALQTKIADVNRAVSLLGFECVYQIIMAESLLRCLPDTEVFRRSYQRCIELSHLAFVLARLSGKANPSELATLALMQDVGLTVRQLLDDHEGVNRLLIDLLDSESMGALLLKNWGLPPVIWQSVAERRYPEYVSPQALVPERGIQIAILFLAGILHDRFVSGEARVGYTRVEEYLDYLGFGKTLKELWDGQVLPQLKLRRQALPHSLQVRLNLGNESTS